MQTTLLFVGDEHGLRDVSMRLTKSGREDRRRNSRRSDFDPVFGREMRRRRRALDLTQADLASLIDGSQVTLSRLEAGKVPLTPKMRKRIETALTELES